MPKHPQVYQQVGDTLKTFEEGKSEPLEIFKYDRVKKQWLPAISTSTETPPTDPAPKS